MFTEMREQEATQLIDADYQFQEYASRKRRSVKKDTIKISTSTEIMSEIFKSFGEIFGDYKSKKTI